VAVVDRGDSHPLILGRIEERAGGTRTRSTERFVEGRRACTDTLATGGCEGSRGYVANVFVTAMRYADRICSQEHSGGGRGSDAEAAASRACDVTSLFSAFVLFSYPFRSRCIAYGFLSVVMNLLEDTLKGRRKRLTLSSISAGGP